GAESREPRERVPHIAELFFSIELRSSDLESRREKQVGDRHREPEFLDAGKRRFVVRVGEAGDFRRAELQVVEPRGLGGVDPLQWRAQTDLHAAILSRWAGEG